MESWTTISLQKMIDNIVEFFWIWGRIIVNASWILLCEILQKGDI